MKYIFLSMMCLFIFQSTWGQRDSVIIRDAWKKRENIDKKQKDSIILHKDVEMILLDTVMPTRDPQSNHTQTISRKTEMIGGSPVKLPLSMRRMYNFGHLERFRIGFIRFVEKDYHRYSGDEFMELDKARSFVMHLNLITFRSRSERIRRIGFVSGIGLEYQRLYFDRDLTIRKIDGMLEPVNLTGLGIENPKRSVLKNLYLTLPVLLEIHPFGYRTLHISGGIIGGMRVHSRTKIVFTNDSGNKQKIKRTDSYCLNPLKAELFGRIGLRNLSVWCSYSLTPIFDTRKAPDLRSFTVGIGISH